MPKYDVTITETLSRIVSVDASDACDAHAQIQGRYDREEIVLTADDMLMSSISAEHEGFCPVCNSGRLDYTSNFIPDQNGARRAWQCPSCGATGQEHHGLTFSCHTIDE